MALSAALRDRLISFVTTPADPGMIRLGQSEAREILKELTPVTGRLWWIADNWDEAGRMIHEIVEKGGWLIHAYPTDKAEGKGQQVSVIFEVNRELAVCHGWAESVLSENWLEEEEDGGSRHAG